MQSGVCALLDDVSLKLGQGSEDVEDQFSSGCGGVDAFGDALEANVPVVEVGDRLDEVLEGAAKPVQSPDDQAVAFPEVAERLVKTYALCLGAACRI